MSSEKRIRVWRVSKDSRAGVELTENSVVVAASRNNFVAVHQAGVTLVGQSINFGVLSENQRHGGFWIKFSDFIQMIPTTMVTPMPGQMPFPAFGLASSLLKDLPFFLALLGAGAVASQVVKNTQES